MSLMKLIGYGAADLYFEWQLQYNHDLILACLKHDHRQVNYLLALDKSNRTNLKQSVVICLGYDKLILNKILTEKIFPIYNDSNYKDPEVFQSTML